MSLKMTIGNDSTGSAVELDLVQLQHMLIGGTAGAGKTVCIKAIMFDLMKDHTPDNLKFVVYDEKCVEFAHLKESPYWLKPVITETTNFRKTLEELKLIVEERYQMFRQLGADDFDSYNALKCETKSECLPRIVVVADECAGFMLERGEEADGILAFLLSEAHTVGIHFVPATARVVDCGPLADMIARISSRIVFRVVSSQDSMRFLNQEGAERLKGNGEFIFRGPDGATRRGQCRYISDEDFDRQVNDVVEFQPKESDSRRQADGSR